MAKSLGCAFCVHPVDGDGLCLVPLPVPSCGVVAGSLSQPRVAQ